MSSKLKNNSDHQIMKFRGAARCRIGIVVSAYHESITFSMRDACVETLKKNGIKEKNIFIEVAPGTYELPLLAKWLYDKKKTDSVIALGCVIKGETDHDIYINTAVSGALIRLSLETGAPFLFGVLTPNNIQQAKDRAGGKYGNKGVECAIAALKMLSLREDLKK